MPVSFPVASDMVLKFHYLHRVPPMSFAFGLYHECALVGVCIFGCPPSRHLQISACKTEPSKVIELNRLWVDDIMPRNTESWFISRCLKQLPPRIVVSYADSAVGHTGVIYRASNWNQAGMTDADRKTPRFDYTVPGKHSRDAFRGTAVPVKVRRKPKYRFWTVTGDRREQRLLRSLCTWPVAAHACEVKEK